MKEKIKAVVTINKGEKDIFPEQSANEKEFYNGVCFSGGGTRSLSATIGQLRALTKMKAIENIDYISCVSGGSWASANYTYYRAGAADDNEFLGPVVSDGERKGWLLENNNGDSWSKIAKNSLGYTATLPLKDKLFEFLVQGPAHEAWQKAVGEVYFKQFGLYEPGNPKFFSLDKEQVGKILQNNKKLQPDWKEDDFVTVRSKNLPFLIVNACIIWPTALFHRLNKVTFQLTPLYIGSPSMLTLRSRCLFWKQKRNVGGGFLEPFAFQSEGPASPPSIPSSASVLMEMPAPANRFPLWQASGMSSAAYAADLAEIDKKLLPKATYWPPADIGKSQAKTFRFGDGGNLENFGLLALLQRRVKNIVVFVNSETPLAKTSAGEYVADSDIAPLFGYTNDKFPHNTVFPKNEYQKLLEELYHEYQAGRLATAKTHYDVKPNAWWNIPGYRVNILWVYNALVRKWVDTLNPEVRKLVQKGADEHCGPLKDFPNYRTIMEKFGDIVELESYQVNLLADMFYWSVFKDEKLFSNWLAKGKST